eukprot:scaffold22560_cov135-Cylindrotheca_fusiformis.AAC.15
MVAKQYLCSVPRQECWDEKVEALLKSLGGDKRKREKAIRRTLRGLRDYHGNEKRSGPGRKSKAEHAIAFYEYALETVKPPGETDNESLSEDGQSTSSSSTTVEGEEKTVESMDSLEFLNQHNDLCDVCNLGGELLCCSTCNLVFHLGCIRPTMNVVPMGDWSCPHCIISGSEVLIPGKEGKQVLKRNSKVWKAAAAGVRQMGRLRKAARINMKTDSKQEGEAPDDTKEEKAIGEDGKSVSLGETSPESDKHKRNMELYNITDSLSQTLKVAKPNAMERTKRPRKPVTLYDPQECPASEWQSDGHFDRARTTPGKSHEKETVASPTKRKRKEDNSASESEDNDDDDGSSTKWCAFCRDDSSIPLCVFCACRVCFGKHDKSKILLCDKCDEEYHSYCLDPPLTSIPKGSKSWFCPDCVAAESVSPRQAKTRRSSASSSPPKASVTPSAKTTPEKPSSTGRPRGRPPKNSPSLATPTPRKRGRPPKSASSTASPSSVTPKRRGRPPKNLSSTSASKKRAAPPLTPKDTSSHKKIRLSMVESKSPLSSTENEEPENVKTSRSGRMIKRNSFHDERDEGEQHLRSSRYYPEKESPTASDRSVSNDLEQSGLNFPTANERPKAGVNDAPPAVVPKVSVAPPSLAIEPPSKPAPPSAVKTPLSLPAIGAAPPVAQPGPKAPPLDVRRPATTVKREEVTVPPKPTPITLSTEKEPPLETAVPSKKTAATAAVPATEPQQPFQQNPVVPVPKVTGVSEQTREEESVAIPTAPLVEAVKKVAAASTAPNLNVPALVAAAIKSATTRGEPEEEKPLTPGKVPRRKPGARECMQISRRFGVRVIPEKYMDTLLDYCTRGKVEHLIRMRERLDEHSRFLESQLAGLEAIIKEKGESDAVVPPLPDRPETKPHPATASR